MAETPNSNELHVAEHQGVPLSRTDTLVDGARSSAIIEDTKIDVNDEKKGVDPASVSEKIVNEDGADDAAGSERGSGPAEPGFTPATYSALRKNLLLLVFCAAQFIDIFNLSSLFPALPTIATRLSMTQSESVWTISAVQLTFSSFLLVVSSGDVCTGFLLADVVHRAEE